MECRLCIYARMPLPSLQYKNYAWGWCSKVAVRNVHDDDSFAGEGIGGVSIGGA